MAFSPAVCPLLGSFELVAAVVKFASHWQLQQLRVVCSATDMPVKMEAQSRECAMYVCGGTDGSTAFDSAECLRPGADRWEPLPPCGTARVGALGVVCRGCFFVCGGSGEGELGQAAGINLCSVDCFSPEHHSWQGAPDMLEPRTAACGAALGDHVYIVGGEGGCYREFVLGTVERLCFDASAHRADSDINHGDADIGWKAAPPMRSHRFGAACVPIRGRLFVCGGSIGLVARRSAEFFDLECGRWESLPDMCHSRVGAVAATHGRRLLICGGDFTPHCAPTIEQFDLDLHVWGEVTPLPLRSCGFLPGLASAGHVFLFGPTLVQTAYEDVEESRASAAKKLVVCIDLATRKACRLPDTQHVRTMSAAVRLKI